MVGCFKLTCLIFNLLLENLDISPQGFLCSVTTSSSTFEGGDPAFHLLPLDLPRVPIPFVSMPLCLEETHDALQGVFGGVWYAVLVMQG
ncbi:hypothetical protein RRF57_009916 [Xylaria bambusicola]|uniref:Secreted protein n=1 Tax=Xylaria bambusicola TaxID=326684 RepID=A0AAN7Z873_9PEZI